MNRRELLKFSLLNPLLVLFKKKESKATEICNDALSRLGATEVFEFPYRFETPKEKTSELTLDKLLKCKDELEKNSLKPDENGMIVIPWTSGTSGGSYTAWGFIVEEPYTMGDGELLNFSQ